MARALFVAAFLAAAGLAQTEFQQAGVCSRCHVVSVLEWSVSGHRTAGTDCRACHGASQAHVLNERNEVAPNRLPRGPAIAALCRDCHKAGCPKTSEAAGCQRCHHVHALLNPAESRSEDPQVAALFARWAQFQKRFDEGERYIKLENWKTARDSFRAALDLVPGQQRAARRLELCERRLNPALPGFEIAAGAVFDRDTGLPKQVRVASLGIPMLLVPAGEFDMGADHLVDSRPVHSVRVEAFYLGRFEVTQAEWVAVMGENPSAQPGGRLPVEHVSWNDAQAFVAKLNQRVPGGGFRLPTEAEWEYAARAGSVPPAPSDLPRLAWFLANSGEKPAAVGTRESNAWSFHDMLGNVWEWCANHFSPYPLNAAALSDGPCLRVLRGGGFADSPESLHPAFRHPERPDRRLRWNGVRLARSVPRLNVK